MKKKTRKKPVETRKKPVVMQPFQSGQIWRMRDSSLLIGLVGKSLVHYKHYKDQGKRPPVLLSGKHVLEKFLQEQRATLLPEAEWVDAAPGKKMSFSLPAPAAKA